MTLHVTAHAIERYQQRVEHCSDDHAIAALTCKAVRIAADFGAGIVRLAGGQRVVIDEGTVVTVLPSENYKRQVQRVGLPRYNRPNKRDIAE